ncbi:54S ribosomal protein img2, mitochondrial [Neonectria magnoliae]|uniref:Large ribosomal subunit protein mL49 n=1 Tax=Neonectria magnoliae TaxID=2732573 RepID=A0ABR1HPN0_9HYPO
MRFLLPRALSAGRQNLLQKPVLYTSLVQRCSFISTAQAAPTSFKAHVGYKPNPAENPVNPNVRNKIHEKKRPIKRPFVPPPTKTEEQLITAFPYIIRRTPYAQLPIYRKFMSGGNRCIIIIKKIDGNRGKLVEDLATSLELDRKDIRLNPTTQQIEIKGNYFEKTLDWTLEKGF